MDECREMESVLSDLPYVCKKIFCPHLAIVFASIIDNYDRSVRALVPIFWNEERHISLCLAMFRSVLTPYVRKYGSVFTSTSLKQNLVVQTLDRVPGLTSLFMVPLPEINRSTQLANVIRHLAALTEFTYTFHSTDELIEQLALHCTHLKELYISGSRRVTNASVQHLLQLRKLQFLDLDGTRINSEHYGFLLSELPEIKNIKFRRRLENILNPLAEENLRTITHINGHAQDVNILTQKCRNISNLHLNKITGDLSGLAALTSLSSLLVKMGDYATSHLNEVLTGIGPTLTELNLFHISNVNLRNIITLCRSLESLSMWKCSFLPLNAEEPLDPQLPHFSNLVSLDITKRRGDNTNYNYIRHYVSLKTIRLDSINIFTVGFMSEVLNSGTFANLEQFYIRETGRGALTMEALDMLIQRCSHLKIIEGLTTCPRLNPGFIQELQDRLLRGNLDLEVM
jgi:hypothetical protein